MFIVNFFYIVKISVKFYKVVNLYFYWTGSKQSYTQTQKS